MARSIKSELKSQLIQLQGQMCWGTDIGPRLGTVIAIFFGRKIPKNKIPRNIDDLYELRDQNLIQFLIECVWRIDSETKIICGAYDGKSKNGRIENGLSELYGQEIVSVNFTEPAFDLELGFANGLTLRIFCSATSMEDDAMNYDLFLDNGIISVGRNSRLRRHKLE